ncbi:MAG: PqqD family protein [Myxococcota bacterium]
MSRTVEITAQSRFRPSAAVASRIIDGTAVLVSLDERRMHELNPVGSHIWQELTQGSTVRELVAKVRQEFDVGDEQARRDVEAFLRRLWDLGLLDREDA